MARFELVFKRSVCKDLRRLPEQDIQRILERIEGLASEPRLPGSEKLSGREQYRIRQGAYHIVYEMRDTALVVTVIKVGMIQQLLTGRTRLPLVEVA